MKFNKKYFAGLLAVVILFSAIHVVGAQTNQSVSCPDVIVVDGNRVKNEFYNYLEAQIESSEPNSNRIANIFEKYRDFQLEFNRITGQNYLYRESSAGNANLQVACGIYYQDTLDVVQEVLIETYEQVLARKQYFVLTERLDSILGQMDELQDEFHNSRSNINEFHDKFSCFLSQCIKN